MSLRSVLSVKTSLVVQTGVRSMHKTMLSTVQILKCWLKRYVMLQQMWVASPAQHPKEIIMKTVGVMSAEILQASLQSMGTRVVYVCFNKPSNLLHWIVGRVDANAFSWWFSWEFSQASRTWSKQAEVNWSKNNIID